MSFKSGEKEGHASGPGSFWARPPQTKTREAKLMTPGGVRPANAGQPKVKRPLPRPPEPSPPTSRLMTLADGERRLRARRAKGKRSFPDPLEVFRDR